MKRPKIYCVISVTGHVFEDATNLYQFSCVKTANPAESCTPKNVNAWNWEISPLANGLFFVLSIEQ